MKGVICFGKKRKLASWFVGPFMITDRVGAIAYRLALSDTLDHPDATYLESPCCIVDRRDQILQNKVILLVRVQCSLHNEAESTWEWEDVFRSPFPELWKESSMASWEAMFAS
ncbi:uncharacterized protein LOC132278413 [Cornus florida]|uniref:uncharacterized protein LOC132278413 n=1 Tax=Cornus florida TaxID=4283 RepID=UPI00289ACF0A|nr:uncharacterized protein LOC132278413 [Cornus florida]